MASDVKQWIQCIFSEKAPFQYMLLVKSMISKVDELQNPSMSLKIVDDVQLLLCAVSGGKNYYLIHTR